MTTEPTDPGADYKAAQAEAKASAARVKALRPWYHKKRFIIGGPVLALILISAISSNGEGGKTAGSSSTTNGASNVSGGAQTVPTAQATPESNLTTSQRNAVRTAQSYLRTSGFSRQGLIDQLSSPYGSKFPVDDALSRLTA